jgi:hypothetical protein
MPKIAWRQFGGEVPRLGPKKLSASHATLARDCKIYSGDLVPMRENTEVLDLGVVAGGVKTIYKAGATWLHWSQAVTIVDSPIADSNGRRIFTGTDFPRVFDDAMVAASVGLGLPLTSMRMGVPAPVTAPTIKMEEVLSVSSDNMGSALGGHMLSTLILGGDNGIEWKDLKEGEVSSAYYVYTFVNDLGEEGKPSPHSHLLEKIEGRDVALSNLEINPNPAVWNLTKKRIYRTITGTSGETEYHFVKDIDIDALTTIDTIDDVNVAMGEILETEDYDLPPEDLDFLVTLPGGILAGVRRGGREVCFSEPYRPYAWPQKYRQTMNHDAVGCGQYGNSLIVLTTQKPYVYIGSHPASMSETKIDKAIPCLSQRGIASQINGVLYPSTDGLVFIGTGGEQVVTAGTFRKLEWAALSPEEFIATVYDGMYLAFNATQGHMLGLDDSGMIRISDIVTALWLDPEDDTLYGVFADAVAPPGTSYAIHRIDDPNKPYRIAEWKSKIFSMPGLMNFAIGKIASRFVNPIGAQFIDFTLFADNVEFHNEIVTDTEPFTLPGGDQALQFQINMEFNVPIEEVYLATSRADLAEEGG